ncbi:1349_t:CDS:2, partial [Acaulospora morrowiae]
ASKELIKANFALQGIMKFNETYHTPSGFWKYTYSDNRINIPYKDYSYPVKEEEPGFRHNLPAGSLYIQCGKIVKFEKRLELRLLIHGKSPTVPKPLDVTKIITANIETLIVNKRTHLSWIAEWYSINNDGSNRGSVFKFTDYGNDSTNMLKAFWGDILKNCQGCIIYFHNWAGYDAFHSLKALVLLGEELGLTIQPMLHNGKVISLKVCELNKVILKVKDSILLCPSSLGSLAKSFKVKCLKGHSPHYFNPMEHGYPKLDYVRPVPAYEFFEPKQTSLAKYQEIIGFQEQFALSPLANCIILGLAFKTWKAHQVPTYKLQVPDLLQTYDPLFQEAYFGGIVDIYKPRVVNEYYYDVNSLYPTTMLRPLPVDNPVLLSLTISEFLNSQFFGFVKAIVQASSNLSIGFLSLCHQGKLLCPGGTFSELFFSEKLRFAISHGYELVSIEFAYRFNRHDNVFTSLIQQLNSIKVEAQAQGKPALRSLAIMLRNSLYGCFEMHPHINRVVLADPDQARVIASAFPIIFTIPFTNGYELIEFEPMPVYYSDTDSIITDAHLPASMIHDDNLGKLKLEHKIKEEFFIAPKLYWLECSDDKEGSYTVSRSYGYRDQLSWKQAEFLYQYFDMKLNIIGKFSKQSKVLDNNEDTVDTQPLVFNQELVKPIEPAPSNFKDISASSVRLPQGPSKVNLNPRRQINSVTPKKASLWAISPEEGSLMLQQEEASS